MSVRTKKQRMRRLVRLVALADTRGLPVPVFVSEALNRDCLAYARLIRKVKTARRYRRRERTAKECHP